MAYDKTIYVKIDGSDAADGLTAGTAKLTPSGALAITVTGKNLIIAGRGIFFTNMSNLNWADREVEIIQDDGTYFPTSVSQTLSLTTYNNSSLYVTKLSSTIGSSQVQFDIDPATGYMYYFTCEISNVPIMFRSKDNGATWDDLGCPLYINDVTKVVYDYNGYVHMLQVDGILHIFACGKNPTTNYGLNYITYNLTTETFSSWRNIYSDSTTCQYVNAAKCPNGCIYLYFTGMFGTAYWKPGFMKSADSGTTWTTPFALCTQAYTSSNNQLGGKIAVDANETVYVAWSGTGTAGKSYYVSTVASTNGGTSFSAPVDWSSPLSAQCTLQDIIAIGTTCSIMYTTGSTISTYITKTTNNGVSYTQKATASGRKGQFCVDASGNIWTSTLINTTYGITHYKSTDVGETYSAAGTTKTNGNSTSILCVPKSFTAFTEPLVLSNLSTLEVLLMGVWTATMTNTTFRTTTNSQIEGWCLRNIKNINLNSQISSVGLFKRPGIGLNDGVSTFENGTITCNFGNQTIIDSNTTTDNLYGKQIFKNSKIYSPYYYASPGRLNIKLYNVNPLDVIFDNCEVHAMKLSNCKNDFATTNDYIIPSDIMFINGYKLISRNGFFTGILENMPPFINTEIKDVTLEYSMPITASTFGADVVNFIYSDQKMNLNVYNNTYAENLTVKLNNENLTQTIIDDAKYWNKNYNATFSTLNKFWKVQNAYWFQQNSRLYVKNLNGDNLEHWYSYMNAHRVSSAETYNSLPVSVFKLGVKEGYWIFEIPVDATGNITVNFSFDQIINDSSSYNMSAGIYKYGDILNTAQLGETYTFNSYTMNNWYDRPLTYNVNSIVPHYFIIHFPNIPVQTDNTVKVALSIT